MAASDSEKQKQRLRKNFDVKQDISTTMTSLKKWVYFQSTLDQAQKMMQANVVGITANDDDAGQIGGEQQHETKYWKTLEAHPLVVEIYDCLQKLILMKWAILPFSQRISFLFELTQKSVIKPWFVQDAQISAFIEEIDQEMLIKNNMIDFANLGHILCALAFTEYSSDPRQLSQMLTQYSNLVQEYQAKPQEKAEELSANNVA